MKQQTVEIKTVWLDPYTCKMKVNRSLLTIPDYIDSIEPNEERNQKLLKWINQEYQYPEHPEFVCVEILQ